MNENERYLVVRNDEEQYSLWWSGRELPAGWHAEGTEGTREECLEHIGRVWTDMRPLSLRRRLAERAQGTPGHAPGPESPAPDAQNSKAQNPEAQDSGAQNSDAQDSEARDQETAGSPS